MSEEFIFNDGRKAEKIEVDQGKTKVIEIYVEPKPEKKLAQRITEKYCVCEREIETLDELTGEVIDKVVEKVSDGVVLESKSTTESAESLEKVVERKINNKQKFNLTSVVLFGLIGLQVLGLLYLLFVK